VFIEERNNVWNTPYLFNAKELDEETGLYYYGARYYDARISVWLSVDAPLINGYYLDGNHRGGVYNAFNLNPYLYCRANPVIFVDPDGNQVKVVTYGQKIASKVSDDDFVRRCATACAEKLGVTPKSFSTGNELVNILSSSSKIATYVNWGHSEPIGLYLRNDQGFYVGSYKEGEESSNISELKKSGMKTTKSCLFIFASCNTAGGYNKYNDSAFAEQFSDAVDLSDATPGVYKITVIGATNFSNLKLDGTVKTDGSFLQIEETFYVTPLNIFALPGKSKNAVLPMERKITDLGSHIDPAKIIKKFDYNDVSISK
jgi:RHS repeat-associated protein